MKKQIFFLTVIVSAALLFSGCNSISKAMSTGKIVFDPDIPEEQSTEVTFDDTIKVLRFNGIDVKEKWYPNDRARVNKVTLPAGSAVITLNYSIMIGGGEVLAPSNWRQDGVSYTTTNRNNIELRFDFEPTEDYAVGAWGEQGESKGFLLGNKWTYGIGVWNKASEIGSKDKAIKYWELGEM